METILQQLASEAIQKHEKAFIPGKTIIPASSPYIDVEDVVSLLESVLSLWYTDGLYCRDFSDLMAITIDKDHVHLTNSGSSASLLATRAAIWKHWQKKMAIVTTAIGFPTTIAPLFQFKDDIKVIFIDIDRHTLAPNVLQLSDALKDYNVIGGIFAHTLGFVYPEQSISLLLRDRFLISDCCDALGSSFRNPYGDLIPVGVWSDLSTYSFFPAHHITTGEGGAVATDDDELSAYLRSITNWGRSCYCKPGQQNICGKRFSWEDRGELPKGFDHKYIFDRLGFNLKITEFQAALGLSQLNKIRSFSDIRRSICDSYREFIDTTEYLSTIIEAENNLSSPFGFPIIVHEDAPFTVNELIAYLEAAKISTRRLFGGNLTRQPAFVNLPYHKYDLTDSDYIMNQLFWIGCHPAMKVDMVTYILEKLEKFIKTRR